MVSPSKLAKTPKNCQAGSRPLCSQELLAYAEFRQLRIGAAGHLGVNGK